MYFTGLLEDLEITYVKYLILKRSLVSQVSGHRHLHHHLNIIM